MIIIIHFNYMEKCSLCVIQIFTFCALQKEKKEQHKDE